MSKLSFRARALDASKVLPIYRAHEIPESADCSSINRTVPQMPTGMEKEEESEHHLQRAICSGTVIPTPDVYDMEDIDYYGKLYPDDYKFPRQLIYMQPFSMEADIPDYDMDSDDEQWIGSQSVKLELTPDKFEEMMDRLEKGSGQTVVTLQEAKALIKEDDDLIIAVYDYWLTKRLKTQHPLIPQVRTEARYGISNHNPYIAFRRRTEKMQTRKNRKNDESSYEKMLKLKRDLSRAVTLLEMVKRREKSKRELLHLSIEVFEKRYQGGDFSGQLINDALSQRPARPAFTPLYQTNNVSWLKDDSTQATLSRKEKRQYKKRRHKSSSKAPVNGASGSGNGPFPPFSTLGFAQDGDYLSSDDEVLPQASPSEGDEEEDESSFPFRRRLHSDYHPPLIESDGSSPPRCSVSEEGGKRDSKFQFYPASVSKPSNADGYRYVGFSRRRYGRGGRLVLDRAYSKGGETFWSTVGYEVCDPKRSVSTANPSEVEYGAVPAPFSPPKASEAPSVSSPLFRPIHPPEEANETTGPSGLSTDDDTGTEEEEDVPEGISRMGFMLGTVASQGDEPLLFTVDQLRKDPEPHAFPSSPYCGMATDDPLVSTCLLNKTSADLVNMHFIELEAQPPAIEPEPWFTTPMDLGDEDYPLNFELIDLESDVPVITLDTEAEPGASKVKEEPPEPAVATTSTDVMNNNNLPEPQPVPNHTTTTPSISGEAVVVLESELNGLDTSERRRLLLDKANKENDRIRILAKGSGSASVVDDEEDEDGHAVENGDGGSIIDSSEECMIVEEQKPNFLLTPKTWIPRVRNRRPRQ